MKFKIIGKVKVDNKPLSCGSCRFSLPVFDEWTCILSDKKIRKDFSLPNWCQLELNESSQSNEKTIDYKQKYDELYLKSLREKAKSWLNNIEPDKWLNKIRGR